MTIVQLKDKEHCDEDIMLISIPDELENYTSLLDTLHQQSIDEAGDELDWVDLFEEKLEEHGIIRVYINDTVYI